MFTLILCAVGFYLAYQLYLALKVKPAPKVELTDARRHELMAKYQAIINQGK